MFLLYILFSLLIILYSISLIYWFKNVLAFLIHMLNCVTFWRNLSRWWNFIYSLSFPLFILSLLKICSPSASLVLIPTNSNFLLIKEFRIKHRFLFRTSPTLWKAYLNIKKGISTYIYSTYSKTHIYTHTLYDKGGKKGRSPFLSF